MYDFVEFPKIPRLSREIVISEKLNGTNAQVLVEHKALAWGTDETFGDPPFIAEVGDFVLAAGSRNRWLQPGKNTDNHGFARWVVDNGVELVKLGPGRHYGEWWGAGIQSGYGLKEKRFSLFNTGKWVPSAPDYTLPGVTLRDALERGPACCRVVPVLYQGEFDTDRINGILDTLKFNGSSAAPGFMSPEGIVIYHVAGNLYFKKTLVGDEKPKGVK